MLINLAHEIKKNCTYFLTGRVKRYSHPSSIYTCTFLVFNEMILTILSNFEMNIDLCFLKRTRNFLNND